MKKICILVLGIAILASCEKGEPLDPVEWNLDFATRDPESGELYLALTVLAENPIDEIVFQAQLTFNREFYCPDRAETPFTHTYNQRAFEDVGRGELVAQGKLWRYYLILKKAAFTVDPLEQLAIALEMVSPRKILSKQISGYVVIDGRQYPFAPRERIIPEP